MQRAFDGFTAPVGVPVLCAVEGCDREVRHREWCSKHYQRWLKHGDPTRTVLVRGGWDGKCRRCRSVGPFHAGEHICKECRKAATYEGRKSNPERSKKQAAQWAAMRHRERREQVLAAYGGACMCCGEREPAFLAVDHINGGGNAHRRSLNRNGKIVGSSNFYRWLVNNGFPSDFQLLCHNCNFAKSHGGCPHARRKETPCSAV